jgi:hypothetical protein
MPYIKKADVKALMSEWIAEYEGLVHKKVTPIRGKISAEFLLTSIQWRMTQLLDFYYLGLIDIGEAWEHIDRWKEVVEYDSPSYRIIQETLMRIAEPLISTMEKRRLQAVATKMEDHR